jgi:hypothetical protein
MSAIANIVVPDAAATPVSHTFKPSKIDGDTAYYVEQSASASAGFWPLSVQQRGPLTGQKDRVFRSTIKLAIPVMTTETVNGVSKPTLLYVMRANVEFLNPEDATLQNRKDLRKLLVGILNDSQVIDNVENQINTY